MKIIVTGSLGHIGKPLTKQLVQTGHNVTVVSSNSERQKDIEALGATAAIGTLDNIEFLGLVFTGADAVFAMMPPNFGAPDSRAYYREISGNYRKAIQQAGVRRLVHLSSYGAHLSEGTGLILGSHDAEGILNGLEGVSITHLRPGYFYTNLFNFVGMIKGLDFIAANFGEDDKIVLVHPEDIAAAAAEELEKEASGISVRYVASDERTANDVAQTLGAAIGKPGLKWIIVPNDQMKEGMVSNGVPPNIAQDFVDMGASTHSGILGEDYELKKPPLGKIKLEDFAKEFAAAF